MALNFNDLPKDRPNGDTTSAGVFEKGIYPGIAKRAELRTSAGSGNSYLVVQIAVTNERGQTTTVFDNFFDTDKPLPRFKLAQFLRAVGVIPSGNFELKDLVKVINNRPLSVALKTIDVGIGYAVWAGIGAVGAALLGPVVFDEALTPLRAFWLAVIVGGVVWLKLADSVGSAKPTTVTQIA